MVDQNPIVAVGLLSARDLERLGSGFHRAYPIGGDHAFEDLMTALDRVEWTLCADANAGKGTGRN